MAEDMDDADKQADQTPDTTGSAGTPDSTGSDPATEIASYKARQAGAEKARQEAEAKAQRLENELAKYREGAQTDAEKDLTELAKTQARLEAAERRAAEAESKAEARILDARFPTARAKFPEITDAVKLAELEGLYTESSEPPTPGVHNESKTGTPAKQKEETADEIEARLLAMPNPEGWA